RVPRVLGQEIPSRRIARRGRSARRHDVWRGRRIFDTGLIAGGSEINNSRSCKRIVERGFTREFGTAPAIGDFPAAGVRYQVAGYYLGVKQGSQTVRPGLYQKELGIGRHGMGPLQIECCFQLPTSTRVLSRLGAACEDHG